MKRSTESIVLCAALTLAGVGLPAHAGDAVGDGQWHFTVTPYLWLPTLNTNLRFDVNLPPGPTGGGGDGQVNAQIGPNDYLTHLEGGLLLAMEARKDRWAITSDLVYLDISAEGSRLRSVESSAGTVLVPRETDLGTETRVKGLVWSLEANYSVFSSERANLDVLAGIRHFGVDTRLDWNLSVTLTGPDFTFARSGRLEQDLSLYDAIVGVRGKVEIGQTDHWSALYRLDAGAGDSKLTWQALAGLGYAYRRTDLVLAYRHLSYQQDNDKLIQDLSFSGPALGLSFRF
jgi:opacity protein-like surface antigen